MRGVSKVAPLSGAPGAGFAPGPVDFSTHFHNRGKLTTPRSTPYLPSTCPNPIRMRSLRSNESVSNKHRYLQMVIIMLHSGMIVVNSTRSSLALAARLPQVRRARGNAPSLRPDFVTTSHRLLPRRNSHNSIPFIGLLHNSRTPSGRGANLSTPHAVLRSNSANPFRIRRYKKTWGVRDLAIAVGRKKYEGTTCRAPTGEVGKSGNPISLQESLRQDSLLE